MNSELDKLDEELATIEESDAIEEQPVGGAKMLPIVVAAFALLSFAVIIFYAYHQGVRNGTEDTAPLLTPNGVAKVKPDNPGGLEVPHQDKLVYNQVKPERDDSRIERLLPPPEDPMQPPVSQPASSVEKVKARARASETPSILNLPENDKPNTSPPLPTPERKASASPPPSANAEIIEKKAESPARIEKPVVGASAKQSPSTSRAAPAVAPDKKAWRIQISALKSDADARAAWARQQKKYPDILGKLDLEVQKVEISGTIYFRVRGGPVKDKAAAQTLCDQLKAKGQGCIIVKPDD